MTQWQNWVTVLESRKGPSHLIPETWVQIIGPTNLDLKTLKMSEELRTPPS